MLSTKRINKASILYYELKELRGGSVMNKYVWNDLPIEWSTSCLVAWLYCHGYCWMEQGEEERLVPGRRESVLLVGHDTCRTTKYCGRTHDCWWTKKQSAYRTGWEPKSSSAASHVALRSTTLPFFQPAHRHVCGWVHFVPWSRPTSISFVQAGGGDRLGSSGTGFLVCCCCWCPLDLLELLEYR